MNENLELHLGDDYAINLINNENKISLSPEESKVISHWSADFSLTYDRRDEASIKGNNTGVLISNDKTFVSIVQPHANGFQSLDIMQGENWILLNPKEVIAIAGARGSKIMFDKGMIH